MHGSRTRGRKGLCTFINIFTDNGEIELKLVNIAKIVLIIKQGVKEERKN